MRREYWLSVFVSITLLAVAGGCASRKIEVKCDARLQPINKATSAKGGQGSQFPRSGAASVNVIIDAASEAK